MLTLVSKETAQLVAALKLIGGLLNHAMTRFGEQKFIADGHSLSWRGQVHLLYQALCQT